MAVNHLEAHALSARLVDNTLFPYCLFLASRRHTQIVAVRGVGDYERLGTTFDDAIGEAFDKTAKLLGLPYPGGPEVESAPRMATCNASACCADDWAAINADFSLSGLKTAVRLEAENVAPLASRISATCARRFQRAVADVVFGRVRSGLMIFNRRYGKPTALVAAGGVAADEDDPTGARHGRPRSIGTPYGAAAAVMHGQRWR